MVNTLSDCQGDWQVILRMQFVRVSSSDWEPLRRVIWTKALNIEVMELKNVDSPGILNHSSKKIYVFYVYKNKI